MTTRLPAVVVSLVAFVLIVVGSRDVVAGDRPVAVAAAQVGAAPVYRWSGCYAGPGVGSVAGRMATDWTPNPGGFGNAAQRGRLQQNGSGRMNGPGFVVGGQVGCNRLVDRLAWGAEVDVQRTGPDETRDTAVAVPGVGSGAEVYHRDFGSAWTATFRGRVGRLVSSTVLIYGTGGLAAAEADTADSVVLPSGRVNEVSDSRTRAGWVVGGGLEWMVAPARSVRVGYLYTDLGSFTTTSPSSDPGLPQTTIDHAHRFQQHLIVVGVNIHF